MVTHKVRFKNYPSEGFPKNEKRVNLTVIESETLVNRLLYVPKVLLGQCAIKLSERVKVVSIVCDANDMVVNICCLMVGEYWWEFLNHIS